MAIHAGSADPATLDAAMRAEYPVLREVNVDRFDANRPGHSMNCTRCVIAADRALSGAPSSAMPLAGPSSIGDVTGALGGTPRPVQGYGEIVDIMAANPPGTRGVVMIARPGQVGHVFTVIHDRNGVVFLDTQVGRFGYLEPNVKLQLIVVPHSAQTTVSAPFAMPEATPAPPATAPGGGVSTPMPRVPVLVEAGHAGTESYRNEER